MNLIPVNRPLINGNEKKYLLEAIESGWISSDGPFVEEFENKFAKFVNQKYAVAVANGTAALEISVKALGISRGQEVIMPTFTIISCALAVIKSGGVPVFVDCYPDTWNMNVEQLESKITSKTVAIMPVHIYGLPVEMQPVLEIAKKHKLWIIEDAAESHGQNYFGKPCGSFGDISTFSFYANKHITTGEGGMIVTNNLELANKCKKLRNLSFEPKKRFIHYDIGWNYRMTNLQAALGLAQLEQIEKTISRKKSLGEMYQRYFKDTDLFSNPIEKREGYTNNYWVYGVVLNPNLNKSANEVMASLSEEGVGTRPFFWPMHKQPILKEYSFTSLPVSEHIAEYGLYLPSGVGTTDEEIKRSATSLLKVLAK